MANQEKNFWSSLPGVLTGLAAVITAVTGFYLAIKDDEPQSPPVVTESAVTSPKVAPAGAVSTPAGVTAVAGAAITEQKPARVRAPFPKTGPLVDCELFPTVNSTASLMSWSNHYHKQIIAAAGQRRLATEACNRTLDYRGMAHCKEPENNELRQALLSSLELCRAVGIEWQDIEHSTILGQE